MLVPCTPPQSSTFDKVIEKEGWPTKYEQMVAESRAIKPVFCPICGASKQAVKFGGQNVRYWACVAAAARELL